MAMLQEQSKLISVILPRGEGQELVRALKDECGVVAANVATGRGVSERRKVIAREVDILTVVVPEAQAGDIFAFLYERAKIPEERGRFMFQSALGAASHYELPDLPMEEEG